jgi:hypothetical protein
MAWKDVISEGLEYGSKAETNNLYIRLKYGNLDGKCINVVRTGQLDTNLDEKYKKPNVLVLLCINVPEKDRNKGLFKEILSFCEYRARLNGQHLLVGPFVTDESEWIIKVCQRRNYVQQHPFSLIKLWHNL